MSRRSSRKVNIVQLETDVATTIATPKTSRKVKVEAAEISTSTLLSSPGETKLEVKRDDKQTHEKAVSKAGSDRKVKKPAIKSKVESKTKSDNLLHPPNKGILKRKAENDPDDAEAGEGKVNKKRKSKEEKEAEATMPIAARTAVKTLKRALYIGAHVSAAGGVQNSIRNALQIGANAYALFLKSQRKWNSPTMTTEARDKFSEWSVEHEYDQAKHVLPHGSYLVNLAQADPEKAEQAYSCFLDDLQRCEMLGIKLYNFHPGSTGVNPRPEAIFRIASQLNKAHKATKSVITVLENMAGAGNVIGSTWEDLRDIIQKVDDKSRVGVCIDTCHTFAAGYDLRSPEAFKKTMDSFSEIVGMSYLKALHLNDSKAPFNSNRDLHANIGTGFLGLRAFHNVVNFTPFENLPMVLETPIDEERDANGKVIEDKGVWAREIKLLEGLIGVDADTEDFQKEEARLQELGAEQRKKFQEQMDKKKQKTIDSMFKKASPNKRKGKVVATGEGDDSGDDDDDGGCKH